jgi:fructosamine-3-kinase
MQAMMEEALRTIGDASGIVSIRPVSGGDINRAYRVETKRERYFVKTNRRIPARFFYAEAEGLERIRATGTIAVPRVYRVHESAETGEGLLVLEWIEGERTRTTEEELGRQLAALHQTTAERFGLETDNFIARLPQPNGWYASWTDYYRERRLLPQVQLAERLGRMTPCRRKQLTALMDGLDRWLPRDSRPSLLHGDLWGGNWLAGPGGRPYLIDPSAFYGDREMEIAFTELFGGFSPAFYRSYQEVWPLSPGYAERKPLYQLFYLLVHLNLFGESYGAAVDRILARYAG